MELHVGLIGASSFGKNHLRAFQESDYVREISLAGRSLEKLEPLKAEHSKVGNLSTDFSEFFDNADIDLIDIVLPHDMHLPVSVSAMEAGKHVICEKPPARTMAEFDAMVATSRSTGKQLFIIMNQLYNPVHRKIRESLEAGAIGRPFLSYEYGLNNELNVMTDMSNWRADNERCGGGIMIDGGFHQIYRHLFFFENFGRPDWVTGTVGQIGLDIPEKGEDFFSMTIGYDSGLHIQLLRAFSVRQAPPHGPGSIAGEQGTLVLDGPEDRPFRILTESGEEAIEVDGGTRGYSETIPPCVHYYLECLAQGREPRPGLEMAARTLEIIDAAKESSRIGQRIQLREKALSPDS